MPSRTVFGMDLYCEHQIILKLLGAYGRLRGRELSSAMLTDDDPQRCLNWLHDLRGMGFVTWDRAHRGWTLTDEGAEILRHLPPYLPNEPVTARKLRVLSCLASFGVVSGPTLEAIRERIHDVSEAELTELETRGLLDCDRNENPAWWMISLDGHMLVCDVALAVTSALRSDWGASLRALVTVHEAWAPQSG